VAQGQLNFDECARGVRRRWPNSLPFGVMGDRDGYEELPRRSAKRLEVTRRGAGELRKKFLDDSLPCAFSKKIENFKAATL